MAEDFEDFEDNEDISNASGVNDNFIKQYLDDKFYQKDAKEVKPQGTAFDEWLNDKFPKK